MAAVSNNNLGDVRADLGQVPVIPRSGAILLCMPRWMDDSAKLARWFDSLIISSRLGEFLKEHRAFSRLELNSPNPGGIFRRNAIETWLGSDLTAVMEQGLQALPLNKLILIQRQPEILLALQGYVLENANSQYWNDLLARLKKS